MKRSTKKIIVNALSISRIIGAILLPFIFTFASIRALIILLIVLFITDFLDGLLARRWKVQTIGGSILDPVGDKLLAIACIMSLLITNKNMIALLVLEIIIGLTNVTRILNGEEVKSSIIGKLKTWFLSISIILGAMYTLNPNFLNDIVNIFGANITSLTITKDVVQTSYYLTLMFEILTMLTYLIKALKTNEKSKFSLKNISIKALLKRLFDENAYESDKDRTLIEIINKIGGVNKDVCRWGHSKTLCW